MPGATKEPRGRRRNEGGRALAEVRKRLRRLEARVEEIARGRPPRTETEMDEAARRALEDPARIPLDGVLDALGR